MIVKQVDHLLTLFELFAQEKRPMTMTQLSGALGLPKSSTHNLIETLSTRGYLYEVRQRGGFYPSRKLLATGEAIAVGDPVTALINEFLGKMAYETGETALLASQVKDDVIYLAVAESRQSIRYSAEVGSRRPVYATSGGKAILSTFRGQELHEALQGIKFADLRENTISDQDTLKKRIEEGLSQGFFLNLSEYTPDVTGIGVPIEVEGRQLGLSVAGPNYRMEGRYPEFAKCLHKTADEIVKALQSAGLSARYPYKSQ
ncbi:IclR family transcriptional regulator [Ruegeria atlantica]|uniref:IclR family transcriptional regulator n=1 Tax=Ruegeria atlantica TaxID=81569 RepID=UPI0024944488|nr:IclR family transcriptional regulator [Ruegeria atlantica]